MSGNANKGMEMQKSWLFGQSKRSDSSTAERRHFAFADSVGHGAGKREHVKRTVPSTKMITSYYDESNITSAQRYFTTNLSHFG